VNKRIVQQSNHKFSEIFTPAYAINPLIPFLDKEKVIWECAYGKGHLKKAFENAGFKIVGTKHTDFFSENIPCDLIITNPPYGQKGEFLKRAFELGKPFAFLLPLTTLEGIKRGKLFAKYGIQLIIPNRRVNFIMPNKQGSAWFPVAWFCYKLNLPKDLNFVKLDKNIRGEFNACGFPEPVKQKVVGLKPPFLRKKAQKQNQRFCIAHPSKARIVGCEKTEVRK